MSPVPDWQNATLYYFSESLGTDEWAWQFLRRNPDYRADWHWFKTIWADLEADYGCPPKRDFQQWKRDPRAYRKAVNEQGETESLLIECWMGQKWGFYKFPLDPEIAHPQIGTDLLWRPHHPLAQLVDETDHEWLGQDHAKVAYGFDLSLPLAAQFEQARRFLLMLQKQRSRQGSVMVEIPQQRCHDWIRYLRYLDAESENAPAEEIAKVLSLEDISAVKQQAHEMTRMGYRRILQVSTTDEKEAL